MYYCLNSKFQNIIKVQIQNQSIYTRVQNLWTGNILRETAYARYLSEGSGALIGCNSKALLILTHGAFKCPYEFLQKQIFLVENKVYMKANKTAGI